MRGFLLDTNILSYWFNKKTAEHRHVVRRVTTLDADSPLRISAISWGEIEYGHLCVSKVATDLQAEYRDFVSERLPSILPVRYSTAHYYGQIRARLFEKFAPRSGRRSLRPCQLVDPVTAVTLGIQENDLWIAAQAIEFNLVLVTHDRGSTQHLRDVAADLLEFDDWAE